MLPFFFLYVTFIRRCFPQPLLCLHFHQQCWGFIYPHLHQHLLLYHLKNYHHSDECEVVSHVVMIYMSLGEGNGTHSSTLAWKIPQTEEPGRLQSMGSLRVRHDWVTSLSLSTFMHWRRKWQPTPVFLPEESQGWGSLVGCCLWGRTESDMTEVT